jgi:hypothetical protein
MGISEYENIEIFNKTQSFGINKCENQILSKSKRIRMKIMRFANSFVQVSDFKIIAGLIIYLNIDLKN